ncbi:hypothetical protein [Pseudomonas sp. PS01300]|uniref:hypothetical protein n=1 Tax=Pseudomonas sp. PS01300 TaxID=2991436 RepID=UPI00249CDEE4|nr:hypothetical protein [Pseudomonas sp. PS01300]
MDTNKMRAAFEALILADGKSIRRSGDSYHFGTVHRKWLFWQEAWNQSREAVVVELPEVQSDMIDQVGGEQEVRYYPQMALITAIEVQGLKVAP